MHEKTSGFPALLLGLAAAFALVYQPKTESAPGHTTVEKTLEKTVANEAKGAAVQPKHESSDSKRTPSPKEPASPAPLLVTSLKNPVPTPIELVVAKESEVPAVPSEISTSQIPQPIVPPPLPPIPEVPTKTEVPTKIPESETHLQIVNSGSTNSRNVAITFDDGPHPTLTLKVLDVLRERKVKATFFVLGGLVKKYPWILRQIVAEGHEVGNHTYDHRWLTPMSNDLIGREITDTQDAIRNAIGYETTLFRPPFGAFRNDTKPIFKEHNLSVVLWNVDPKDWSDPKDRNVPNRDRIFSAVTNQTRNGSIILCHDIHKATLEALPAILDTLQSQGYSFSTVSELCGLPPLKLVKAPVSTSTAQAKP